MSRRPPPNPPSGQLDLFGELDAGDASDDRAVPNADLAPAAGAASCDPQSEPPPTVAAIAVDRPPIELPDQGAREQIRHQLDTTLFVEAGAGAGKTTELSARVIDLVGSGVAISAIAAITFTEKAAAELRHRVRSELDLARRRADDADDRVLAGRFGDALAELDEAAIGTLHAFAARILRESPIEAAIPPRFTVLDEVRSDVVFDQHWNEFVEELLEDPAAVRLVHYVDLPEGTKLDGMRRIARAFADNWDLVRERVDLDVALPGSPDVTELVSAIDDFLARVDCPDGDRTLDACAEVRQWLAALDASIDEFDVIARLETKLANRAGTVGAKANWKRHTSGEPGLDEFRRALVDLEERRVALASATREAWSAAIGAVLARFTLDGVERRRTTGELQFHDLLVLARELVVQRPELRVRLHHRYQRLLLDEFQDTDPIQLELAVRLAADPALPQGPDVHGIVPMPGRLFLVGDPKQSIYRFRRADVSQYLAAREQLQATEVLLTTNFRAAPAVLEWVNEVFDRLIVATPGSQPAFHPLDPYWTDRPGSVTVLGVDEHLDQPRAEELRRREATDIVEVIRNALAEGWTVHDDGVPRPCRLGDITILLPARTSLPVLEAALGDAGIPYQAENSSLVYATAEIRALLLALRAIDDPSDELAVVSTLRSPLFGCSDRQLFAWHRRGGRWRLGGQLPDPLDDDPVHDAFVALRGLVADRHLLTPSALLQRLVEQRRVLELALAGPGARDVFRRVRFVVDQARAWSDAGGAGLRSYLAWTRRQGDDGRYVAEVVLPETDIDAVRIMTVHAAKGLEFPITILAGLTTKVATNRGVTVVWPPGTWSLAKGEAHEAFRPVDEQMGFHERLRLLYVACTRAVDHLVVSLHRLPPSPTARPELATSARLLAEAGAATEAARRVVVGDARAPVEPVELLELPWTDQQEWATRRGAALRAAARARTLSATAIAVAEAGRERAADSATADDDGLEAAGAGGRGRGAPFAEVELLEGVDPGLLKDAVDLELPPWQRGRYGTAVGRAVHAVLQSVELAGGAGLGPLAAAHAAAEGIVERTGLVQALARAALDAPIVRAAAAGAPHWRELYVAAPIAETVVEGYIDLLVRSEEGYVVVDYKTDRTDVDGRQALVERYTPQLAVYAVALEAVLGEPVVGARLVFLAPDGATERAPDGWADAVDAMRARLQRGDVAVDVALVEPARPGSV